MPKVFEKFRGLNNVSAEEELSTRELRAALNVDLTDRGKLKRRQGFSLVQAGSFHSLWADTDGAYVVYEDALCEIKEDLSLSVVRSGLTPNDRMTYTRVAGDLFYSNGVVTGKIKNGVDRPWGVEVPVSPGLAVIAGGMDAGAYQVRLTFIDDLGEESGASPSSTAVLSDVGGLRVSLPDAAQATVAGIGVYITAANGEEFYYVTTAPVAASSIDVLGGKYAYPLRTGFLSPPDAGQIVGSYGGRIYYINDGVLWYTEAYNYGLVKKSTNFIQMPKAIIEGVIIGTSMYISDGTTKFIRGEPGQMEEFTVSSSGIIKGTPLVVDQALIGTENKGGMVAIWASDRGYMLGDQSGEIVELTRDRVSFPVGEIGAALLLERSGMSQILTNLKEPFDQQSNMAFGDRVTAEVRRNGVVIN